MAKGDKRTRSRHIHWHAFDEALSMPAEEMEIWIGGDKEVLIAGFVLNPRMLRGSDFLMRWSQGVWSEERLVEAVNSTERYYALPYGPSGTAPEDDPQEYERYFDRLEKAGLGGLKRPDLLIYRAEHAQYAREIVADIGGEQELPFVPEDDDRMRALLARAIIAVECENSLWQCENMPCFGTELKPMKRLGGKLGLAKNAVLPTIIIKQQDRGPLNAWQADTGVPIHIWHVFFDLAYGIALDQAEKLIAETLISPEDYTYYAPGGATTKKTIYKIYYQYGYLLAKATATPDMVAEKIIDKNGHVLPFVRFEGGRIELTAQALEMLATIPNRGEE